MLKLIDSIFWPCCKFFGVFKVERTMRSMIAYAWARQWTGADEWAALNANPVNASILMPTLQRHSKGSEP